MIAKLFDVGSFACKIKMFNGRKRNLEKDLTGG